MSGPFSTVCPSCSAKLRLKSAPPAGKRIRCPKCEEAFVPASEEAREVDPWDLPDESSMPSPGDDDDDANEDEETERYVPARSMKKKPGKRKKPAAPFPTGLVVGGVAVVGLIVLVAMFAGPLLKALQAAAAPKVDPAYFLAHDNGLVFDMAPNALLALPGVPPTWTAGPNFEKFNKEMENDLGIKLADIAAIQMSMVMAPPVAAPGMVGGAPGAIPGAMPGAGMGQGVVPKMRVVMRLSKVPSIHSGHKQETIEGVRCYAGTDGQATNMLFCQGTDNTLLMAEPAVMRETLAAWKRGDARPNQPPAPGGPMSVHFSGGMLAQADTSAGPLASMAAMPGAEDVQKFVKSMQANVSGVTLSLLNAGGPSLNIAFRSADPAKAQAFKADFDTLRASLSGQFKLLAMAGMGQALGPASTPIQSALDAQSQGTGNETTLAVPIPAELIQQGLATMPSPFESALSRGRAGQPGFGRPGFGGGMPGGS
jgi:predicted Zn finger-like uncharacterized protein